MRWILCGKNIWRLQQELDKIAFERECEEKRKKLKNNKSPVKTTVSADSSEKFVVAKGLGKIVLVVGGFITYFRLFLAV